MNIASLIDHTLLKPTSRLGFVPLPVGEPLRITWPTPNQQLWGAPEKFFACTRSNPDFGKPGWTRDCGRRFHRGCDIAPVRVSATGQTTPVILTDCATGQDFVSREPTWIPHDEVSNIFPGRIVEAVIDEAISDFGRHVVIEHHWPKSGAIFFTLYGHLAEVWVVPGAVLTRAAVPLGKMGQTARSPDARNWLAIAPHLHFEVWDAAGAAYDPVEFLKEFLPRC